MLSRGVGRSEYGVTLIDDYEWDNSALYAVPFRAWLSLEYDLRKDLKFLASTWVSNGWKTRSFGQVISDYSGNDGFSRCSR